jgi:hypothetical protein
MTRCVLCIVEVTGTFRLWEEGGRGGAGRLLWQLQPRAAASTAAQGGEFITRLADIFRVSMQFSRVVRGHLQQSFCRKTSIAKTISSLLNM